MAPVGRPHELLVEKRQRVLVRLHDEHLVPRLVVEVLEAFDVGTYNCRRKYRSSGNELQSLLNASNVNMFKN